MAADSVIDSTVYAWLSLALIDASVAQDTIIFGYENAPQMEGFYVVVAPNNHNDDIPPEVRYRYTAPDLTIDEDIHYRLRATYNLDFFGPDCLAVARHTKALLYSSNLIEEAQRQKLGFVSFGETVNLGYEYKGAYIPRAVFTLDVYITVIYTVTIQTIGQVRVLGKDESGNVLVDETIIEPSA